MVPDTPLGGGGGQGADISLPIFQMSSEEAGRLGSGHPRPATEAKPLPSWGQAFHLRGRPQAAWDAGFSIHSFTRSFINPEN